MKYVSKFSRISVKTPVCVPIVERGLEEIDDFPRKVLKAYPPS